MGFFKKDYKKIEPNFTQEIPEEVAKPVQVAVQQPIQQIPMQQPMQYQQPMQQFQPQVNFQPSQLLTPQMNYPAYPVPQMQSQPVADPNAGNWNNDKNVVKNQLIKVKEKISMIESDLAYVKESIKLLNRFLE